MSGLRSLRAVECLRAKLQMVLSRHRGDPTWARNVQIYAHVKIHGAKAGDQALLNLGVADERELGYIIEDVEAELGKTTKGPTKGGTVHAGACQS